MIKPDRKIIDYVLVEGVNSIRHYLTLGWQPYGDPTFSVTQNQVKINQVMVKFEPEYELICEKCDNLSKVTEVDTDKKIQNRTVKSASPKVQK